MSRVQIELKDENRRKIIDLASRTGRTQDEIVNEAVEQYGDVGSASVVPAAPAWKTAWLAAAGMWKDRDDIPALKTQLREEWNRVERASESSK